MSTPVSRAAAACARVDGLPEQVSLALGDAAMLARVAIAGGTKANTENHASKSARALCFHSEFLRAVIFPSLRRWARSNATRSFCPDRWMQRLDALVEVAVGCRPCRNIPRHRPRF